MINQHIINKMLWCNNNNPNNKLFNLRWYNKMSKEHQSQEEDKISKIVI